jgi:hypothetical protein
MRPLLVALAVLPLAGCGSHDFYDVFPTGTRLENASPTQAYRAFDFRLDPGQDGRKKAPTGTVTVTFGTAAGSFDVPGKVQLTEVHSTVTPYARLTVTYQPAEETAGLYRDLVRRLKAEAAAGDPARLLPDDLPPTQTFDVKTHPGSGAPNRRLTLTDGYGQTLELKEVPAKP